jgi:hypothetical protein
MEVEPDLIEYRYVGFLAIWFIYEHLNTPKPEHHPFKTDDKQYDSLPININI